ncbi:hypothetical protein ACL02T_32890 [Pseudonocardia sp. RS010]|uniref:hypothetical protein n=1 Tax=Pseudonocardia sp. RS010 TaxID=3385979 RepID=UPI0039A3E7BE
MITVAQAAAVGDPFAGGLVQYGALGLLALGLAIAVKVLFARTTANADAERHRADRLEEELRRINTAIQDRQLGVLAEATRVLSQVLEEMRREDRR